MSCKLVVKVLDGLKLMGARHGHQIHVTVSIEPPYSLVAIINLVFRRSDPEQLDRAHLCADQMLSYIHDNGLEVYRARADMMGKITARDPDYWGQVSDLSACSTPITSSPQVDTTCCTYAYGKRTTSKTLPADARELVVTVAPPVLGPYPQARVSNSSSASMMR